MRQFIYKMAIFAITIVLIYEFTIGKQVAQLKDKTNIFASKEGRREGVNKLRVEIKKAICEVNVTLTPDAIDADADIIKTGLLDSYGFVELICHLESQFQIKIEDKEITGENLGSVEKISNFVAEK